MNTTKKVSSIFSGKVGEFRGKLRKAFQPPLIAQLKFKSALCLINYVKE